MKSSPLSDSIEKGLEAAYKKAHQKIGDG